MGRYLQFALVILAAGSIYPLIYLKAQYQETILAVYNLSTPQLNSIFTILGLVFVVGYFPSGILSDKFSAKNLLSLSLLGTALVGFGLLKYLLMALLLSFLLFGDFFSVFTFWSSHMKVVKLLSTADEDGRFLVFLMVVEDWLKHY